MPPSNTQWSGLGGDAARSATVISPTSHPPYTTWWSHVFPVPAGSSPGKGWEGGEEIGTPDDEVVGYPLLGDGLVYVVRQNTGDGQHFELDAFSQSTGELVWSRTAQEGSMFHIALDGDNLFVDGMDEEVTALDARSGTELWSRWADTDEPLVAEDGVLYYVSDGYGAETIAVNEMNGRVLWKGDRMFNPVASGPVIGDGSIFVMGGLGESDSTYKRGPTGWAFDATSGEQTWEDALEYAGDRPSSWTTVLAEGHLFSAGNGGNGVEYPEGTIVNPANGAFEGVFPAPELNSPVIDGTSVIAQVPEHYDCPGIYYQCKLLSTTLTAYDYVHGRTLWSFNGDGQLDSGVIRVNENIFVGSASGNLYAVNATTGAEVWKGRMPDGFFAEEGDRTGTPTGMAADGSMIAVAAGDSLTLLTSGGPPRETEPTPAAPPSEAGTSGPGTPSLTGPAIKLPASHTDDYKRTSRGGCLITRVVPDGRIEHGHQRIRIRLRCSAAGRVTLALRYRRHGLPGHPGTLATIVASTGRVRPGTPTVTLTLTASEMRLARLHRPAKWMATLAKA